MNKAIMLLTLLAGCMQQNYRGAPIIDDQEILRQTVVNEIHADSSGKYLYQDIKKHIQRFDVIPIQVKDGKTRCLAHKSYFNLGIINSGYLHEANGKYVGHKLVGERYSFNDKEVEVERIADPFVVVTIDDILETVPVSTASRGDEVVVIESYDKLQFQYNLKVDRVLANGYILSEKKSFGKDGNPVFVEKNGEYKMIGITGYQAFVHKVSDDKIK